MRKISPLISILTPTYNSESTLELTLKSIEKQNYPKSKVEVLIVDGGSTDKTLKIARKYDCRILKNTKTGIIEGEYLGFFKANGRYLIGLAPDEVFESKNSLRIKLEVFEDNEKVKAVLPEGYKTPKNVHPINNYINEFGDPFSYFMYRDSKGYERLSQDLKEKHRIIKETENYTVFSFKDSRQLPLIELWAGGSMVDLRYLKSNFPQIKSNPGLIPLSFYLLNKRDFFLAVTKNDPTLHYSSGNIKKYFKKLRSRVEFNVYETSMGKGGYIGREKFESKYTWFKKYLFLLYAFSIVFPLIDSLKLSLTRKKFVYMLHLQMSVYVACAIIYYKAKKSLGIYHNIKLYGH